jgi:hypothetical protein
VELDYPSYFWSAARRNNQPTTSYRAAWRLIDIELPEPTTEEIASFSFALNRQKLRRIRRREGFKNLKDDLALRSIYHQLKRRIEAHIFVVFIAYCLQVTLRARVRPLAPVLTPGTVLDNLPPPRCSMCASRRP